MQDGLTGSAFGDFAIKQGSAWLAFENELGVQAVPDNRFFFKVIYMSLVLSNMMNLMDLFPHI